MNEANCVMPGAAPYSARLTFSGKCSESLNNVSMVHKVPSDGLNSRFKPC